MRLPPSGKLGRELGFTTVVMQRACQALVAQGVLDRHGYKLTVRAAGVPVAVPDTPVLVLSYLESFSRRVTQLLAQAGVSHRLIELSYRRDTAFEPVLRRALRTAPSGLLICAGHLRDGAARLLQAADFPVVACTNYSTPEWSHSVAQADSYRGVESAVQHLYELGHRQIAHLAVVFMEDEEVWVENYRGACLRLGLEQSAANIWRSKLVTKEGVRATLRERLRAHPEITALCAGPRAADEARQLVDVPKQLSLVCFGELEPSNGRTVTCVLQADEMGSVVWACAELVSRRQRRQAGLPPREPVRAFFAPNLRKGDSTIRVGSRLPRTMSPRRDGAVHDPAATWLVVYPSLRRPGPRRWEQLDLTKLANHSITKQHGWLGSEPLEHFPPGLREIHGVPFRVIDEARNQGQAVVTFRSEHTHTSGRRELPTRARIGVGARVQAIYFLHGCGSARPVCFARYEMHHRSGRVTAVPLISLGLSRREALPKLQPNVQDWWPGNVQENFPHAHYATVYDPADPGAYERTLYSMEWINPERGDEVEFIDVVADPVAGPTLALVSVTTLT